MLGFCIVLGCPGDGIWVYSIRQSVLGRESCPRSTSPYIYNWLCAKYPLFTALKQIRHIGISFSRWKSWLLWQTTRPDCQIEAPYCKHICCKYATPCESKDLIMDWLLWFAWIVVQRMRYGELKVISKAHLPTSKLFQKPLVWSLIWNSLLEYSCFSIMMKGAISMKMQTCCQPRPILGSPMTMNSLMSGWARLQTLQQCN